MKAMTKKHVQANYNQITENIYIGTNFCCVDHFDSELLGKGITTDISLEEERIDSPFGIDAYLWLPVKDHSAPTLYQFNIGIKTMEEAIKNNQKVYVHCKHGHGRSPTLVAGYFIKSQGMTPEEAVELIKSKRPETHITEIQLEALRKLVSQ